MSQKTPVEHTDTSTTSKKRSLWRNRDFLLLWSGQAISMLGTSISTLALPLLVLALTHSPAQAGLLAAIRMVPYLLFSLPVGALIDRWDRKAVMIRCDAVRWLALGSIPLAFAFDRLSIPQLYIVGFIEGTANVLFSLAQISALPRVVEPEHVPQAYALDLTAESTATLLGPGISGVIIGLARTTVLGAVVAYLADSISYLASVISLRFMRVQFQAERAVEKQRGLWRDIGEGLRFLWGQKRLRLMALLGTAINFLQAAIPLALIVLMQKMHISAPVIGLVFSAGGVGGIVGGFLAPLVQKRLRFGQIVIFSVIVWILATILLAVGFSVPMFMAGQLLIYITWPIYGVTLVSYRLSLVPDELQGRINSSFRVLTYGSEPLGAAIGGFLLVFLSGQEELWFIGAGLGLCTLFVAMTELRKA